MIHIEYNLEKELLLANPSCKDKMDRFLCFFQRYIDDGIYQRGSIRKDATISSVPPLYNKTIREEHLRVWFLIKIQYNTDIFKYYLNFLNELNYIVDEIGYDLVINQSTDVFHTDTTNKDIFNTIYFKIK